MHKHVLINNAGFAMQNKLFEGSKNYATEPIKIDNCKTRFHGGNGVRRLANIK